jgi:hypothetical protein
MVDTRCAVTELVADQCAHCRPVPDLPRSYEYGPWFEARFPGRCSQCQERTYEGDTIRADGEGGYLCEECGG